MSDNTIFGFDEEELQVWFLIIGVVFSIIQFLSGNLISATIIGMGSFYLLYRENKKEDWQNLKSFVNEFRKKEQQQKEILKEQGYNEIDDELLKNLHEDMKRWH